MTIVKTLGTRENMILVDPTPFHLKTYHVENNHPFYPELFPQAFEVLRPGVVRHVFGRIAIQVA
jgi:hypothetical protein